MTEPLSDERITEGENHALFCSGCRRCHAYINELSIEIRRLKSAQAIPPDVQAAMEKFKEGPHSFGTIQAALIINWAVSHHGKDGA